MKTVIIRIFNGSFTSEHSMKESSYLDILKEFGTVENWLKTLLSSNFTVEVIKWKQTINFSDFCDAFRDFNRNENFSYEGKKLLFDYLEEYEESTGTEIELDIIAICCDYNEDYWEDIAKNYSIDIDDCEDEDEKKEAVKEYLEDHTFLIGESENDNFVYQAF